MYFNFLCQKSTCFIIYHQQMLVQRPTSILSSNDMPLLYKEKLIKRHIAPNMNQAVLNTQIFD